MACAMVAFMAFVDSLTLQALGSGLCLATPPAAAPEFVTEFKGMLTEIKTGVDGMKGELKTVKDENAELKRQLDDAKVHLDTLRKQSIAWRQRANGGVIKAGHVSTECAKWLASVTIMAGKNWGMDVNEGVVKWATKHIADTVDGQTGEPLHDHLEEFKKAITGANAKAALTTTDIPLPVLYSGEIVELVDQFGTFRRYATRFPMGAGTVNLPKLKTDPAFGFIDISASIPEKSPQIENVAFDAKKAGGLIRIPTEIDEDSIVALGQFIARYIARNIANWEDTVGWNADGTATYKTLKGVRQKVVDNAKLVTLGAGLTAADDVTLAHLRSLRAVPDSAVLGMSAYYMHVTMESILASFNTGGTTVYIPNGVQGASLDGFPIRWINKFPVNSSTAIVSTIVATFGDMSYWYLGDRSAVRIDTSREAFFGTDEIGVRALWRFTVNEMATTHMAGLRTAAA